MELSSELFGLSSCIQNVDRYLERKNLLVIKDVILEKKLCRKNLWFFRKGRIDLSFYICWMLCYVCIFMFYVCTFILYVVDFIWYYVSIKSSEYFNLVIHLLQKCWIKWGLTVFVWCVASYYFFSFQRLEKKKWFFYS